MWPNVRECLIDDLAYLHKQSGPCDLILFTGDLTQQGLRKEFDAVDEILTEIERWIAGRQDQLARAAASVLGRLYVSEVVHARSEPQDLQWRFDAVARLGEA